MRRAAVGGTEREVSPMPGGTNVVLDELAEQDATALRALLKLPSKHWRSKAIRFALHFTAANYRPDPAEATPTGERCPDCEDGIAFSEETCVTCDQALPITCPSCKGSGKPVPAEQ